MKCISKKMSLSVPHRNATIKREGNTMKIIQVDVPEDYVEWRCYKCHGNLGFCVKFYPSISSAPSMFACPIYHETMQQWEKIEHNDPFIPVDAHVRRVHYTYSTNIVDDSANTPSKTHDE